MDDSSLAEGWALARRYYAANAWKWTRHPFALDLMWDGSVDALLFALRNHDAAKGMDFKSYLRVITRDYWRGKLNSLLRRKRDMRKTRDLQDSSPPAVRDSGQEIVDGADVWERKSVLLSDLRRRAVSRWMRGETWAEIATVEGVTHQAIGQRINLALDQLRQAV